MTDKEKFKLMLKHGEYWQGKYLQTAKTKEGFEEMLDELDLEIVWDEEGLDIIRNDNNDRT